MVGQRQVTESGNTSGRLPRGLTVIRSTTRSTSTSTPRRVILSRRLLPTTSVGLSIVPLIISILRRATLSIVKLLFLGSSTPRTRLRVWSLEDSCLLFQLIDFLERSYSWSSSSCSKLPTIGATNSVWGSSGITPLQIGDLFSLAFRSEPRDELKSQVLLTFFKAKAFILATQSALCKAEVPETLKAFSIP